MGEPGGIGPDVTLLPGTTAELRVPPFYCLADPDLLAARAPLSVSTVRSRGRARRRGRTFRPRPPGRPLAAPVDARARPSRPGNAAAVIEAIARAVGDVRSGRGGAVVTNPINKKALYDAGFQHPGHTEFLGTLSAAWTRHSRQRR